MTSAPRVLEDTQDMELLAIRTPGEIAQAQTPGDPEADENSIPCFRSCSEKSAVPCNFVSPEMILWCVVLEVGHITSRSHLAGFHAYQAGLSGL